MRDLRRKQMEQYISQHGEVSMQALQREFPVSINTLRADLAYLVQTGAIEKVYGGVKAIYHQEVALFDLRTAINRTAKIRIAQTAAARIENEDILFLDSGTTTMHLMESLDPAKEVTIITGNLYVISAAYRLPNVKLILLPGIMNRRTYSLSDGSALEYLKRFQFTKAIMAATGISRDGRLAVSTYADCELKRYVATHSDHTILLVDSSKFGSKALMAYATISEIEEIITDSDCSKDFIHLSQLSGVRITSV